MSHKWATYAMLLSLPGFVFRAVANICRLIAIVTKKELRRGFRSLFGARNELFSLPGSGEAAARKAYLMVRLRP